jgi:hypothetical protein
MKMIVCNQVYYLVTKLITIGWVVHKLIIFVWYQVLYNYTLNKFS